MSDDKPESPKDAARRHMELSRALDEPERRDDVCGPHGRLRCDECAYLAEVIEERDALKATNLFQFGQINSLRAELATLKAENAKLLAMHEHLSTIDKRAIGDIIVENKQLRRELEELKGK